MSRASAPGSWRPVSYPPVSYPPGSYPLSRWAGGSEAGGKPVLLAPDTGEVRTVDNDEEPEVQGAWSQVNGTSPTTTSKTDKKWSGTCRDFVLKLDDGSVHTARFEFAGKRDKRR